jgi:hypothetical protein
MSTFDLLPSGGIVQIYSDKCPLVEKIRSGIKKDLRRFKYKKAGNLTIKELPHEVQSIANMLDRGQSFKSKYVSTLKRVK